MPTIAAVCNALGELSPNIRIPAGPFKRTLNLSTTGDIGFNVPNPNTSLIFHFGNFDSHSNANSTIKITEIKVTGP
ncbi:MAG: hypothetical protein LBC70_04900 [Chitinispirillales bacterium]|nr:hypothetical protein [Chitinispirillales bacterium]